MKATRWIAPLATVLLLVSSTAFAQAGATVDWANKNGAIGLGGNTTLGGTNGINIRTYVGPLFGLSLTLGFGILTTVTPDPLGGPDTTQTDQIFGAGLYGSYKLAYWQRGHLSTILGVDFNVASGEFDIGGPTPAQDFSGNNVLIGLGLLGEWFPTQYLSLFIQGGLRLDFINDDDFLLTSDGSQTTIRVNNTQSEFSTILVGLSSSDAGLLGAFGFTVWFK